MTKENAIKLFEEKQVRSAWDAQQEKWFFSIIDVIEILSGTDRPRKYWSDLKAKLKKEGSQLSENIGQLKMQSADGKYYLTDVADTEQLFRLIQSVPKLYFKTHFQVFISKNVNHLVLYFKLNFVF